MRLIEMYNERDLKNPAAIVDANHSNSNKKYFEQIRIVKEVLHSRSCADDIRKLVKGAEKAAEAGKIPKTDKHALVIKLLKMKNIEVTPFLDAFIDAAIKEMDEVAENIADEITKD